MNKIEWQTSNYVNVGKYKIPCVSELVKGYNQGSGMRRSLVSELLLKSVKWPLSKLRCNLLVDGFIKREVGKLIRKYIAKDSVFLDIGCGDMSLRKYVPRNLWYNALDLEFLDFHVMRVLRGVGNINLVISSATEIPAPSNTASFIVSTEAFEHIPEIDKAIKEVYRVATPGAILICSIPNNYCHKYVKKGRHPGHINNWTFEGFVGYMKSHNFEFIEGFMKGKWIAFPLWLTKTSYQLPLSSGAEYYNTNFFYVFRVRK